MTYCNSWTYAKHIPKPIQVELTRVTTVDEETHIFISQTPTLKIEG